MLLLTDEGRLLCGRQALPDGHEEDGHGEEGRDAQGHLFARLGRHVKDKQGCKWEETVGIFFIPFYYY